MRDSVAAALRRLADWVENPVRYEVQDFDARNGLQWYSAQMCQRAAVRMADRRALPEGFHRLVRHVGNGAIVYRRSG